MRSKLKVYEFEEDEEELTTDIIAIQDEVGEDSGCLPRPAASAKVMPSRSFHYNTKVLSTFLYFSGKQQKTWNEFKQLVIQYSNCKQNFEQGLVMHHQMIKQQGPNKRWQRIWRRKERRIIVIEAERKQIEQAGVGCFGRARRTAECCCKMRVFRRFSKCSLAAAVEVFLWLV